MPIVRAVTRPDTVGKTEVGLGDTRGWGRRGLRGIGGRGETEKRKRLSGHTLEEQENGTKLVFRWWAKHSLKQPTICRET